MCISSPVLRLSLLMDWSKCSPGALQLLVVLYYSRSSALRRCRFFFFLLSHGGATTGALDEMAPLQWDSLASRCDVSPRITASGTSGYLFAKVWIIYQILFTGSCLLRHYAVDTTPPLSGAVQTQEPPTRLRTDNTARILPVFSITLHSSLQLSNYVWWHCPVQGALAVAR